MCFLHSSVCAWPLAFSVRNNASAAVDILLQDLSMLDVGELIATDRAYFLGFPFGQPFFLFFYRVPPGHRCR